ncbi:putative gamma-glutamylcyclotransferase, partial [Cucurbita argyrosperma subsp. sororia]
MEDTDPKRHQIFTYGTLKRGLPNHSLMQELIHQNHAIYLGSYSTHFSFPLLLGPSAIPYLINLPGSGRPVRGELYALSDRGLALIDELEETRVGYYDRLPVQLVGGGNGGDTVVIGAECYFAGKGNWEGLWSGEDRETLEEYTELEAMQYVGKVQRSKLFPFGLDLKI